jgi:hypothetical protein
MISRKIKKLAKKESLILWSYLAEKGGSTKTYAIRKLHAEGKLSKNHYDYNCPLCHYLRYDSIDPDDEGCGDCIWPGAVKGRYIVCADVLSPYCEWFDARTRGERKAAARAVYDLIYGIEIY